MNSTNLPRRDGRALTAVLVTGIILYIGVAVAFAAYLLTLAFFRGVGEFEKAAIGALIAVIGTGLTALGALYTANRQAAAAREVEILRARLTGDLDTVKAQSAESLERLKASLDAEKTAHRELYGAATIYFYALRSAALRSWDEAFLKKAESGMFEAARHLIYVSEQMRGDWFRFWQEADTIYRKALAEPDEAKRRQLLGTSITEPIQDGQSLADLRDLHSRLQETATRAIEKEMSKPAA